MRSAEQVVRDFCAAVSHTRPRCAPPLLLRRRRVPQHPDGSGRGDRGHHGVINMFLGMCEGLEFEIHHLASDGSTVLTERTDTLHHEGKDSTTPGHGCLPCRATGRSPRGGTTSTWRQVNAIFGAG